MRYLSTRGAFTNVSSAGAIRAGIAPDGGLFTPESIPRLTPPEIQAMAQLNYQELATKILSLYLTDFQPDDLAGMTAAAYAYPAKFSDPKITPVVKMADGQYILELFHGPTCAFKDVALQLLPHLMTKASQLEHDSSEIVILVATSGDTGKAALEGFRDVPGTRIIVFFPEQGVSEIQRLQMVTQEGRNTAVIAVRGNFDDAQFGVKQIFTDPVIAHKLASQNRSFSSANSINWGRLVPQIVYYFYGYFELCRQGVLQLGDDLNITVPTGNFGNILAAYFAKTMGLPIAKLICASNVNNVLTGFIETGRYDRNRPFYTTISPSMDILISSNLERLLYYLSEGDSGLVKDWMRQLNISGAYQVNEATAHRIKTLFYSGFAGEVETMDTIRKTFLENQVLLDTHTAVGKVVYDRYRRESGDTKPVLLTATASPFKFNTSVITAIQGLEAVRDCSEIVLLEKLQTLSGNTIPAALRGLEQKSIRHQSVCEKEDMGRMVEAILEV